MKSLGWFIGWWVTLASAVSASATGPFLEVVASQSGTNLLQNPGFELGSATAAQGWSAAPNSYRLGAGEGRGGTRAVVCEAPDETGWRGVSQALTLNRTQPSPIRVRGWSRAESVSGSADAGYALYVDILYADGTPLWGQIASFPTGTQDWQLREVVIYPEKAVRTLTLYCLFRGHSGRVWFDDVSVEELSAGDGAHLFQGVGMALTPQTNAPPAATQHWSTGDGLRLGLAGTRVVSVQFDGRERAAHSVGGFLVRDVAANSDVFGFANGVCAELGLGLEVSVAEHPTHLAIEGRVRDLAERDRAILLLFALPMDFTDGRWWDDIRRERSINGGSEYFQGGQVGCGSTGFMSTYPLACAAAGGDGVALALDMAKPAVYRLVYHAGMRQFFIAFDFGLATETARFPGAAEFGFMVYRADPRWGFRSALQRLMDIHPSFFEVRSTNQGIWMPFTDVSTVEGWEDFGFRYHEGDNNVAWDDGHNVLSFRYTEPMTWWMPMPPEVPRTLPEALRIRDQYAEGAPGYHRTMAIVSRTTAMRGPDGQPQLIFRNEPWANGAVWSLNPNPHLPADPNAATVHWNEAARARYRVANGPRLDGEYLDSLEGYVTANLDFDRSHFRHTNVPLTFGLENRHPALFKGLVIHEFTRWISDEVRGLGGLLFANSVPYRFSFLCPWLDVMGTETDWMPGGVYTPAPDAQLALWRTMAARKPYLLLMNTDYSRFTSDLVERYFLRCLAFGFYPSMFSHNAAEHPYWRNPDWYNRDRPLFRRYIPLIRQVAEAGWEPVTKARFDAPGVALERFGRSPSTPLFFTLLNDAPQDRTGFLAPDPDLVPLSGVATELLSQARLAREDNGWRVTVPARSTAVVRWEPGPRFASVDRGSEALRVSITSPPDLEHVLESTTDLKGWTALRTNRPTEPAYSVELPLLLEQQFLRLRW